MRSLDEDIQKKLGNNVAPQKQTNKTRHRKELRKLWEDQLYEKYKIVMKITLQKVVFHSLVSFYFAEKSKGDSAYAVTILLSCFCRSIPMLVFISLSH